MTTPAERQIIMPGQKPQTLNAELSAYRTPQTKANNTALQTMMRVTGILQESGSDAR
jgi:hypothetical protein